jgi:hypothetical protein
MEDKRFMLFELREERTTRSDDGLITTVEEKCFAKLPGTDIQPEYLDMAIGHRRNLDGPSLDGDVITSVVRTQ